MTIIVETGAQVSGANSYVSLADVRDFARARGIVLSLDDAALEASILKAMDYFEAQEEEFMGYRVSRDQALSFPRTNLWIEDYFWSSSEIPRQVLYALYHLTIEVASGVDPFNPPLDENRQIASETVGPISVSYAGGGGGSKIRKAQNSSTYINALRVRRGLTSVRG